MDPAKFAASNGNELPALPMMTRDAESTAISSNDKTGIVCVPRVPPEQVRGATQHAVRTACDKHGRVAHERLAARAQRGARSLSAAHGALDASLVAARERALVAPRRFAPAQPAP
eukprot:scaffold141645_cov187-Phaeocystis_antarctica.AAC.1